MQRFAADWLADWRRLVMAAQTPSKPPTPTRQRPAGRLHLLTVREVQAAKSGDHSDGGNLILRVRGDSASWVFRFTPPSGGNRREMGLGVAWRGSAEQAGESLKAARRSANEARELLTRGVDPIQDREAATRDRAAGAASEEGRTRARAVDAWPLRARLPRTCDRAEQNAEARSAVDREPAEPSPRTAVEQADPRHRAS